MSTTLQERVDQAVRQTLDAVLRNGEPALIVQAPPGAGKTWLIETLVATAVKVLKLRVAVVTPKTSQGHELLVRLIDNFDPLPLVLLQSTSNPVPQNFARHPRFPRPVSKAQHIPPGPVVVVSNVSKFRLMVHQFQPEAFDLLICDEAYQVTAAEFGPLWHLAKQVVLVGDPGQLPPIVQVNTAFLEASRYKVHRPAPIELRERVEAVPIIQLPASRRLPQDTVDLIQPSLYPNLPFVSAASAKERCMGYDQHSGSQDAIDQALNLVASGATIVGLLLPERSGIPSEVDEEVAALGAAVVRRMIDRGATWQGNRVLAPQDIGCIDSHVASGAELTRQLQLEGFSPQEVLVYPPEIWQGNERPLMVIKHPLSGKEKLDSFALEPGRLCVALSRHQVACVLVGRDGVGKLLEAHSIDCGERAPGAENTEWHGWWAHQTLWNLLEEKNRLVRIDSVPEAVEPKNRSDHQMVNKFPQSLIKRNHDRVVDHKVIGGTSHLNASTAKKEIGVRAT